MPARTLCRSIPRYAGRSSRGRSTRPHRLRPAPERPTGPRAPPTGTPSRALPRSPTRRADRPARFRPTPAAGRLAASPQAVTPRSTRQPVPSQSRKLTVRRLRLQPRRTPLTHRTSRKDISDMGKSSRGKSSTAWQRIIAPVQMHWVFMALLLVLCLTLIIGRVVVYVERIDVRFSRAGSGSRGLGRVTDRCSEPTGWPS